MDKIIGIACKGYTDMPYTELHDFQGDLKTLTVENYERLKKQIVETGFAFAEHAWLNPEDQKWYIIDGHQRIRTVRQMVEQEGWQCPNIPVVPVEAASIKEAKLRVLQGTSQFGHMEAQGLYEFMSLNEITMDEVKLNFDLPHIDLQTFQAGFFDDSPPKEAEGATELTKDSFQQFSHTCPKCGFSFNVVKETRVENTSSDPLAT